MDQRKPMPDITIFSIANCGFSNTKIVYITYKEVIFLFQYFFVRNQTTIGSLGVTPFETVTISQKHQDSMRPRTELYFRRAGKGNRSIAKRGMQIIGRVKYQEGYLTTKKYNMEMMRLLDNHEFWGERSSRVRCVLNDWGDYSLRIKQWGLNFKGRNLSCRHFSQETW